MIYMTIETAILGQMRIKNVVYVFLVGLLLFGASLGAYYLIRFPKTQTINTLTQAQSQIAIIRLSLVSHRSAITQYVGLNPKLAIFSNEQPQILNSIETSLIEAGEQVSQATKLESSLLVYSDVKGLIAEKNVQLDVFNERVNKVVHSQKEMMKLIKSINSALTKFYEYNPVMNLSNFEMGEDIELSKEAMALTIDGMKQAAGNFEKLDISTAESQEFLEELDSILVILDRISSALEAGDVASSEKWKSEFIKEYFMLKKEAFDIELSVFKSDQAVNNLREVTNIIRGLEEIEGELEEALEEVLGRGIGPI